MMLFMLRYFYIWAAVDAGEVIGAWAPPSSLLCSRSGTRNYKEDGRQIPPTAAHTLRKIRAWSVRLRRPAQPSGTEGNPRRKAPPGTLRNYFACRWCVEII